ncbi:MAG: helix-turn-helix domain-containing protein [Bacteroidota bacterium]|nr:helix-turn-helix domain-containing protein [Bacteroidota bacterium]MDP4206271.1 helix-turn-helix domain-containing protein [Bacteroidota bacterium]
MEGVLIITYNNVGQIISFLLNSVYNILMILGILAGMIYVIRNRNRFIRPVASILPSQMLKSLRKRHPSDITIKNYPDPGTREKLLRLLSCMEKEQLFRNKLLNRKKLAKHVNISTPKMTYMLHRYLEVGFSDFVNHYRVDAVKKRLSDPNGRKKPLILIAKECGFNTRTTFYRIFKDFTGYTPIRYLERLVQEEKIRR